MLMGLEIADALHKLYPQQFQIAKMIALLGSQSTVERLERGDDPKAIVAGWDGDLEKFRAMRAKYLLSLGMANGRPSFKMNLTSSEVIGRLRFKMRNADEG